ncbi:NmrA domain-containing protein [Mycena indigotica]|uniref:NmrA domain-containing protein n=1 Tax=Mycena indigotica TaxID=2126181 RepID=A0A8H6WEV1_9AGAR|nr:NmrA domain-containing protein [Mycena indigotica]KAF7316094.1 NmrA domain-containing protein [Mycena indigotica]
MTKTILVAGATGHQGRALIRALVGLDGPPEFRIFALTRTVSSSAAQRLSTAYGDRVKVVEGDLDAPTTIRKVFEDAKQEDGIWGVFCVLAFPGLGANADAEERQGKLLADLAFEFGVSSFILSTSERGGEYFDDDMKTLDRVAKVRIERHVKELGTKGLPWTLLRPGFFMENYDGWLGAITVGVLKAGLKPGTTNRIVAVDDIGRVAAAVFCNPSHYQAKILTISDQVLTMSEQEAQYKRATGRAMPTIPVILASAIIWMNVHTQELLADLERMHNARENGLCPEVIAQAQAAREACPEMHSLEAWAAERKDGLVEQEQNWNQVSLWQLLRGKL